WVSAPDAMRRTTSSCYCGDESAGLAFSSRRPARMAIRDRFDCRHMQKWNKNPTVAARKRDKKAAAHQRHGLGIANFIVVAAADANSERLKWVACQQFADFVAVHAKSLSWSATGCRESGGSADGVNRQTDTWPHEDEDSG